MEKKRVFVHVGIMLFAMFFVMLFAVNFVSALDPFPDCEQDIPLWAQSWGYTKTQAVSGDYNNDGKFDMAIYDNKTAMWYIKSGDGAIIAWEKNWGFAGTQAVSGDYNNDGIYDLALWNPADSKWYIQTLDGKTLAWAIVWGTSGTIPVSGDYDGDGKFDMAFYDNINGVWYIQSINKDLIAWAWHWGYSGAKPVSGDYNGDGKYDLAVYDSDLTYWYALSLPVCPVCGNEIIEKNEICDGTNLSGQTCVSRGFASGILSCNADCIGYNTSLCVPISCTNECSIEGFKNCTGETPQVYEQCIRGIDGCLDLVEDECAEDELCLQFPGQSATCAGETNVNLCSDYESESTCSAFSDKVCKTSANSYLVQFALDEGYYTSGNVPSDFCETDVPLNPDEEEIGPYAKCNIYIDDCRCEWETAETECVSIYDSNLKCIDENGEIIDIEGGTCKFSTTSVEDKCSSDGNIYYTRKATYTPAPGLDVAVQNALKAKCIDNTVRQSCGLSTKLGFFSWISFFVATGFIAGIYLILGYLSLRKTDKTIHKTKKKN